MSRITSTLGSSFEKAHEETTCSEGNEELFLRSSREASKKLNRAVWCVDILIAVIKRQVFAFSEVEVQDIGVHFHNRSRVRLSRYRNINIRYIDAKNTNNSWFIFMKSNFSLRLSSGHILKQCFEYGYP